MLNAQVTSPAPVFTKDVFRRPPETWLEVTDHRLAYRRFGSGPDLVFVHGWPLHSATFRGLVPLLADRFTCHLFDLPGSGATESAKGARSDFGSHATTLKSAIDVLGLTRYGLVAHDSGGLTARLLAASDRRVAALVTGNTEVPEHTPSVVLLLLAASRLPGGAAFLRRALSVRAVRRSPLGYGGCFADPTFLDGDFHELMIAPLLASSERWGRQVALLRGLDVSIVKKLPEVHARITAPVQLVWGAEDPMFPLEHAKAMLSQFPGGATLAEIPGGKCFVHDENPAAFAAHAKPFLSAAFERAIELDRS
jgi:haloalkane dehalogenase